MDNRQRQVVAQATGVWGNVSKNREIKNWRDKKINIKRLFAAEFQGDNLVKAKESLTEKDFSKIESYRLRIDEAEGFRGVWEIVKDTVKVSLGEHRLGMLLFLDDLPLHLGAYHQLGTNNIVLNRSLVNIVEAVTKSKKLVNAFVYSILTHEYLHALGHVSEAEVRSLVYDVSRECFGEDHILTMLAEKTPWMLIKGIPLNDITVPKQAMELIKDLEKPNQRYIV
ncbi:MAG: hypothetical protein E3J73_02360 [Candidatus Bathyarchaeum sp.]|nr:MAG: hypothetical protein E3J73_02360 [Candidatus Bathyarchaeum sp.]